VLSSYSIMYLTLHRNKAWFCFFWNFSFFVHFFSFNFSSIYCLAGVVYLKRNKKQAKLKSKKYSHKNQHLNFWRDKGRTNVEFLEWLLPWPAFSHRQAAASALYTFSSKSTSFAAILKRQGKDKRQISGMTVLPPRPVFPHGRPSVTVMLLLVPSAAVKCFSPPCCFHSMPENLRKYMDN
jgi:hypothetical protein